MSVNEYSIVELFDTIDNVENSNDENDVIINKVLDKILTLFISNQGKQREKARKQAMFLRYLAFLKSLEKIIKKQIVEVDFMLEHLEPHKEAIDNFINLKKELLENCMEIYKLDSLDMSEVLDKKEQSVYQSIQIYNFIKDYYLNSPINEENDNLKKQRWKTYYYLFICLEKQNEQNQTFISYFKKNNSQINNDETLIKQSNFYAADFQGQLSKNIYCQRKKMRLTQMQLSERSGIDRTMIAKIEKIKQPTTLETAIKLLSALNMGLAIYPLDAKCEKL